MKAVGWSVAGLAALAVVAPGALRAQTGAPSVASLADEYLAGWVERNPELASFQRIEGARFDRVSDNTPEALAEWEDFEDRIRAALARIDAGALDRSSAVTHAYLQEALESSVGARVCRRELWGLNHISGWHTDFPLLMANQPVGTAEQGAWALARLSGMADYIDQDIANLRRGLESGYAAPGTVVERTLRQVGNLIAVPAEQTPFLASVRSDGDGELVVAAISVYEDRLLPAMRRFEVFLRDEYLPRSRTEAGILNLPDGRACYLASVRSFTTLDGDPEELFERGQEVLAELTDARDALAAELGFEDAQAAIDAAAQRPENRFSTRQEMLDFATALAERADSAAADWFGITPASEVRVESVPEHQEASAPGGQYYPGAPDGSRPGVYLLNTGNPGSRSGIGLETLTWHEAIPGHHFQLALALEREDAHPLTRYLFNSGFAEGWALYAELLADEMGLFSAPEPRLAMYNSLRFRAARLIVDPGIHYMGWSREEALTFLQDVLNSTSPGLAAEVDRYMAWPGQATSYLTGMLEIRRLREEAESRMEERFDIRSFHDRVLEDGSVPLGFLDRKIAAWSERSGPPDLEGFWSAEIDHSNSTGHLVLEFTRHDGHLLAIVSLPDIDAWNAARVPAEEIEGGVRIAGSWDLTWTEGGALRGSLPEWLAPAHDLSIEMTRSDEPAAAAGQDDDDSATGGYDLPAPTPLWETRLGGAVWGGVIEAGGLLLVGDDAGVTHALDPESGATRWSVDLGAPIRALPTADGGQVFVRTDDGRLHWLDVRTGRIIRQVKVSDPVDREGKGGVSSDPMHHSAPVAVAGVDLFVGNERGEVLRLDRENGAVVWRRAIGGPITGRPTVDSTRVFVGSFDGSIYALDRSDGSVLWTHDTGAPVPAEVVLANGTLFAGSRSWQMLALDPDSGEPRWSEFFWFSWVEGAPAVAGDRVLASTSDAQSVTALRRADGHRLWSFDAGGSVWSAPAVAGTRAVVPAVGVRPYFIDHRGSLHLIDLADGRPLWRFDAPDTGSELWGFGGSPLVHDGVVYAADLAGNLVALPADPVDASRFGPVESRRIQGDGADVFVQRLGGGPPVLVLHGFAAEWRPGQWRHLLEALDGRTVIGMDIRGHGRSGKPHEPTQYGQKLVADVVTVLDSLGIGRADLIGYSLGGFVALEAARRHPDRIRSTVLLGQGWTTGEELTAMAGGAASLAAVDTTTLAPRDRESFRRNDVEAFAALVSSYPELGATAHQIAQIEMPVLSVVGDGDPRLRRAEGLVQVLPEARLRVLEGRDHGTVIDDPEYAEAIAAFLAEVSPTGPVRTDELTDLEAAEADTVLDGIYRFLDAMHRQDAAGMREALVPESRFTLIRNQEGRLAPWVLTGEEFIEALTDPGITPLEERLRTPRLRIEGPLATVWADYQVFAEGELSHCGTDAFQLARLGGVWKLLALADTPPHTDCGAPFAPNPRR